MSSSQVLKFFKEKRDINIHTEPVSAVKEIGILIEESVNVWMDSGDVAAPLLVPPPSPFTTVTEKYKFADWPGTEGVLQLCEKYLRELRAFVSDGQTKGFLTP